MTEWLWSFWEALTWQYVLIGLGAFLLSLGISFGAIALVMVNIPKNYFSTHYRRDLLPGSSWFVRWGVVVAKNVFGVFLILLGLALSLPGVPGQGFLTILLGIIMLDIPGKRPFEARLIKRPAVLSAVNSLRARWGKEALEMD